MSLNLVGTHLHGGIFVQDDNRKQWAKIDNVMIGESPSFEMRTVKSNDIGALLDKLIRTPEVASVAYNWNTKEAIIRSGFNIGLASDSIHRSGFTTFVVNNRANFGQANGDRYV